MFRIIFGFILILALVVSGYVYWTYFNVFSEGTRTGVLVKFSKKGNIFKTFEGEMVQSGLRSNPQMPIATKDFPFSVVKPAIADSLAQFEGQDVRLHYTQYRGTLPWRGDSEYIVDRIENLTP